jgi:hypothetical protein
LSTSLKGQTRETKRRTKLSAAGMPAWRAGRNRRGERQPARTLMCVHWRSAEESARPCLQAIGSPLTGTHKPGGRTRMTSTAAKGLADEQECTSKSQGRLLRGKRVRLENTHTHTHTHTHTRRAEVGEGRRRWAERTGCARARARDNEKTTASFDRQLPLLY